MVLLPLIEALLQLGGMAFADELSGPNSPRLTHLEIEIEALANLLDPYNLRITLSNHVRESIEALALDKAETKAYVREHIRQPLSRMIQRGEVDHGQRIYVDWSDGVRLSALNND